MATNKVNIRLGLMGLLIINLLHFNRIIQNTLVNSNCKPQVRLVSSVAQELLDEGDHLLLVDGAGAILVESGEDLIEGFLGELVSGS